jgi:hypothetical protein
LEHIDFGFLFKAVVTRRKRFLAQYVLFLQAIRLCDERRKRNTIERVRACVHASKLVVDEKDITYQLLVDWWISQI